MNRISIFKTSLLVALFLTVGGGCKTTKDEVTIFEPSVRFEFSPNERNEWRQIAQWSELCDEDFRIGADAGVGGLALFSYTPTESILRVTCGVYAYQSTILFYHVSTASGKPVTTLVQVPTYDLEQKKVTPRVYEYEDDIIGSVFGFGTFNEADKTVTIYTKDRGVGDCGTKETLKVGPEFTLLKTEYMSCEAADEFHLQNPDAEEMPAWPVVYKNSNS